MTALKGLITIAVIATIGISVFMVLAAVKLTLLSLRFLNRRVLDQF